MAAARGNSAYLVVRVEAESIIGKFLKELSSHFTEFSTLHDAISLVLGGGAGNSLSSGILKTQQLKVSKLFQTLFLGEKYPIWQPKTGVNFKLSR